MSGVDGHLYAAGYSTGSGTGSDFTVISLASNGNERWVYRHDGPAHSDDCAYSIVCGADGNIYAAGASWDDSTSIDFTVISLTPTGDERWIYKYNGPRNGWDDARSIVYGADGDIYAAGWSEGSGTLGDFTVISLTPTGDEQWVYRYNGPGNYNDKANSIVFGADGNLYAAGTSCDSNINSDFAVISLTQTGDERWIYLHDGPAEAFSIACDVEGNLYAAGQSEGSSDDFTVIGLTSGGGERWLYRYNAPSDGDDQAYSVISGADGNVYAAGWGYAGLGTYSNFTAVSLTSTGDERWVYRYPSRGVAKSVVYGTDGNVYTAGWSQGSGPYDDFTVISLDPAIGVEEWSQRRLEQPKVLPSVVVRGTAFAVTSRARDAKVAILDASGRVVAKPGSAVWHTATIAPGAYFVHVRSGTQTVVRKVLVVE